MCLLLSLQGPRVSPEIYMAHKGSEYVEEGKAIKIDNFLPDTEGDSLADFPSFSCGRIELIALLDNGETDLENRYLGSGHGEC